MDDKLREGRNSVCCGCPGTHRGSWAWQGLSEYLWNVWVNKWICDHTSSEDKRGDRKMLDVQMINVEMSLKLWKRVLLLKPKVVFLH